MTETDGNIISDIKELLGKGEPGLHPYNFFPQIQHNQFQLQNRLNENELQPNSFHSNFFLPSYQPNNFLQSWSKANKKSVSNENENGDENGTIDLDKKTKDKKQEKVLNLLQEEESKSENDKISKKASSKESKGKDEESKLKDKGDKEYGQEVKNIVKPLTHPQLNEISNGQWSFGQQFNQNPYLSFSGLNPGSHMNRFLPLAFDYQQTPYNPQPYPGLYDNDEFIGNQNRANMLAYDLPQFNNYNDIQQKLTVNNKEERTSSSSEEKLIESQEQEKEKYDKLKKHEKQYESSINDYNKTLQKHKKLENERNKDSENSQIFPNPTTDRSEGQIDLSDYLINNGNYPTILNKGRNQYFEPTLNEVQNRLLPSITNPLGVPERYFQPTMDDQLQPFLSETQFGFGINVKNPGSGINMQNPGLGINVQNPGLGINIKNPGSGIHIPNPGSGLNIKLPMLEGQNRMLQPTSFTIDAGLPGINSMLNPMYGGGQLLHNSNINQFPSQVSELKEINELGLNLDNDNKEATDSDDTEYSKSHVIERDIIKPTNTIDDPSTRFETGENNEIPEDFIHQKISKKDDTEDKKEGAEFGFDYSDNENGNDDDFSGSRLRRRYYDADKRKHRSWMRQSERNYDANEEYGDEYGNESYEISSFEDSPFIHHKRYSSEDDENGSGEEYEEDYIDEYYYK